MESNLDYQQLYRLPFSKNDNFNAWIEITTLCNIKCPGCYRGCDQPQHTGRHKSYEEILLELDQLVAIRNPSMISISGGEATLHPDLDRIISHVKQRGLHPVLFSNGTLLTVDKLNHWRKLGLTAMVVRVDSLQAESVGLRELDLNSRRMHFAKLSEQSGVFLALSCVLDANNVDQLGDILEWARLQSKHVGQLLWILKRPLVEDSNRVPTSEGLSFLPDLLSVVQNEAPDLRFAAYLGSDQEALQAKWLQAMRVVHNGHIFGYVDAKFIEFVQMAAHWFTGKYVGMRKKKDQVLLFPIAFLLSIVNPSFRKICFAWFKKPWKLFFPAQLQAITVVIPPFFVNGKRDLCDACPDAILHNGRLVPSCSLEEIIRFGDTFVLEKQK